MSSGSHDKRSQAAQVLKAQIDKLNATIDELEVKANLASKDAGDFVEELNRTVDSTLERMRRVFGRAKEEFGDDWQEVRQDAEKLVTKIQDGVKKLRQDG